MLFEQWRAFLAAAANAGNPSNAASVAVDVPRRIRNDLRETLVVARTANWDSRSSIEATFLDKCRGRFGLLGDHGFRLAGVAFALGEQKF